MVMQANVTILRKHALKYLAALGYNGCNLPSIKGKKKTRGVPVVAQWLTNPTRNHEVAGSVPALAQWVNDPRRCRELWCRLQTRLGSCIAVALV